MPASLQDIIEAYHVALNIGIRIGDAIAHTSLCSQIHHHVKVVLLEQAINQSLVSQVTLDELIFNSRRFCLLNHTEAIILQCRIIIIIQIIQSNYSTLAHFLKQA